MSFSEVDFYGVYVAPISLLMASSWVLVVTLRRTAVHFGLLRYVWHPALFMFAVYIIVLSTMVIVIAR
jgi:protein AaeX